MLGEILPTYCAVATLLLALTEVLYGQPVISSLLGTITDSSVRGERRQPPRQYRAGVDNNPCTGLLTVLIPSIEALETVDVSASNEKAELRRRRIHWRYDRRSLAKLVLTRRGESSSP
jgi:hypothetical protein